MSRRTTILSLFAVIALSVLGVILAQSIPNAVFPEFVFHRAIILADNAELPAGQMLAAVTRPLEEAAYSVAGTTLVRSTTTRGSAEIDVNFAEEHRPHHQLRVARRRTGGGPRPSASRHYRRYAPAEHRNLPDSRSQPELARAQPDRAHRHRVLRPRPEPPSHRRRLPGRDGRRASTASTWCGWIRRGCSRTDSRPTRW